MTRNTRMLLMIASLVAVAAATSACELTLPVVDCSGINQPDMGGLVCLGANAVAITASVLALVIALLAALGGAIPT